MKHRLSEASQLFRLIVANNATVTATKQLQALLSLAARLKSLASLLRTPESLLLPLGTLSLSGLPIYFSQHMLHSL